VSDPLVAWRVVHARYAATAFDGEGAQRVGGRFNSPGTRVVYSADTLALAVLEVTVHLPSYRALFGRIAFRVEVPDDLVESAPEPDLPGDWRSTPPSRSTQSFGDTWVHDARTPALLLPSVLLPHHTNLILNPAHPAFPEIANGAPEPVPIAPRLVK
jgi:RES domain-containing protein